jgi:hypothetical protein
LDFQQIEVLQRTESHQTGAKNKQDLTNLTIKKRPRSCTEASGLITPRSGSWSAVAEVVRFHSKVHPSWRWGKLPRPPDPPDATNADATDATRRFRRFINALPEGTFKAAEKFVKEKSEFQQRQEL